MTDEHVLSPYRESDGPAIIERACPKCGAHVSYEAAATSAMCSACDTRFAVVVEKLSVGEPAFRPPDDVPAPRPLASVALVRRGPQVMARTTVNDALAFTVIAAGMLAALLIPLAGLTAGVILAGCITAVGGGIIAWMRSVYAKQPGTSREGDDD
ncbi:MAG TPA: hypothetical protein VGM39_16025 [Kofleriaceae bacterium]|jgi:hypothetical protein